MRRFAICSSRECAHCLEVPATENARPAVNRAVCPKCGRPLVFECPRCQAFLFAKPDPRLPKCAMCGAELQLWPVDMRPKLGFADLTGTTPEMQRVRELVQRVSQHDYPVLILGESGTGKGLVARAIHFRGPRKDKPFVVVDCSALAPTLVESELFGHVKGAFTGAEQVKQGLLEVAQGGTLFLDEIGDMPVELQGRLLHVLQEQEIKPVGSTERHPIRARFIAATNRDPRAAIRAGTFRQDLYFRLNVVQIRLPPLRQRKKDIPLLAAAFLEKFAGTATGGARQRLLSTEAMNQLIAYDWPGNVRELENAIEHAVSLGSEPVVDLADLPLDLRYPSDDRLPEKNGLLPLEELERRAILNALRATGGDKAAVARLLGIGKTTLYRKLKQYREGKQQV